MPDFEQYSTNPFLAARNSLGVGQPVRHSGQWQQSLSPPALPATGAPQQDTADRLQAFDLQHFTTGETALQRLLGGAAPTRVLSAKAAIAFPSLACHYG